MDDVEFFLSFVPGYVPGTGPSGPTVFDPAKVVDDNADRIEKWLNDGLSPREMAKKLREDYYD